MKHKKKTSRYLNLTLLTRNFRLSWSKLAIGIGLLCLGVGLIAALLFFSDLPSINKLKSNESFAVSSKILDRNGEQLYEIYVDTNRTPISIDDLPPYVAEATIAIEDKSFYRHFGLDYWGILRAIINNLQGKQLQGGSTITQQLVKVSLLSRDRTWERKIKEAFLTTLTEIKYSKKDILEMYLNYVPYGGTAWGIEAAARTFFNKSAQNLSIAEAAYLAGLPQSPSRYSPFGNTPELGKLRQEEVLRRMVEDGYLTQEEADQAKSEELEFAESKVKIKAPHFVFYVRDLLLEEYGPAVVEKGGLRVTTTLDLGLQEIAQASLSAKIDELERMRVGNGAALITKPSTGEVLAMVGSRDYFNATSEGQINMTIRERQPGSSIKPLNLATAFQLKRLTPGSVLLDIPTCFQQIGNKDYCPRNYDGTYHGPVTMRQALANSYNIPAVKVAGINSVNNVIDIIGGMGISTFRSPDNYGLSIGLGAGEVTMMDMATAYGTLANQGVKVPPIAVLKIEDYQGNVIWEADPQKRQEEMEKQLFLAPTDDAATRPLPEPDPSNNPENITLALDREVAWLIGDIISDNEARAAAFGSRSQLYIPGHKVAAKTGTTNDLRDNWTVGYTPDFVVTTWVGNSDNTAMNPSLVSGVTGAAPIWNDLMEYLLNSYLPSKSQSPTPWPDKPEQIIEASFCRRSGALPNPESPDCEMTTDYFWRGTEPQETENVWHETWIAEQTGLPPREGDPTDQLKLEKHILLSDPYTRNYCLDCQRKTMDIPQEDGSVKVEPVPELYTVPAERVYQVGSGWTFWEEELVQPEIQ